MSLEAIVANSIAERVHKEQKDLAGISMMHHVYGVSRAVKHLGDKYIIVALLHDSIEDAHESVREDIESEIKAHLAEPLKTANHACGGSAGNSVIAASQFGAPTYCLLYTSPSPRD